MKLIIKQYLASLKERKELDAILPDLVSQLGLTVFSRPSIGTTQQGVDVAAVGSLEGGEKKVYLFSIKSGNLTRSDWDTASPQSLRPSINQILDAYIPHLPEEHKSKKIVICLCYGGDIQEGVRESIDGFISQNTRPNISFEEWNGDKLAGYIESSFIREDLLPPDTRPQLRKSLALLEEPEASYRHFVSLVKSIFNSKSKNVSQHLMAMRQINICLWILFAWAREADNVESAYLASEITLLHAWDISKRYITKNNKTAKAISSTFNSILDVHHQVCSYYLNTYILPHVDKRHALSVAVNSSEALDVNLKLFDILGRLAIGGLWAFWQYQNFKDKGIADSSWHAMEVYSISIKKIIVNNPTLLLPFKDEQAIDISLALLLLAN